MLKKLYRSPSLNNTFILYLLCCTVIVSFLPKKGGDFLIFKMGKLENVWQNVSKECSFLEDAERTTYHGNLIFVLFTN